MEHYLVSHGFDFLAILESKLYIVKYCNGVWL